MHVPTSFHRHTPIIAKSTKSTIRVRLRAHPSRIYFCTFCTLVVLWLYFGCTLVVLLYFRYSTSPGSDVLCFRALCTFESTNRTSISHENFVCLLNPETYFSKYIVLLLRSVLFVIEIIALHAAHCSHSHTLFGIITTTMTESLCAAQEYCLLVALPVTNTHLCPACGVHVHAICGELCEDASITYHTTCF